VYKIEPRKIKMIMANKEAGKTRRHCMLVYAHYPLGETRVEREAQALVEHGYEVDVICLRTPTEPAMVTVDGVQVYRLPVRRRRRNGTIAQLVDYVVFLVLAFIRLTKLHRQRRYSSVQVHNLPDFLVFAALIPKLAGARVILDLHDLMPEFYAERFQRSLDSLPVRLVRWQEWLSCRFADHIITVTELWRQALIERGQPPEKVTVVMNVADDRIFHRDVAAEMSGDCDSLLKPEAGDDRFRLIYHGALAPRHGLDLALRAIDVVRQTAPDIHLTLHGDGEYRRYMESLVDELALQDHVQFSPDFVPTAELPELLKRADLGVVPYRDGVFTSGILPTKLMEYAALGIPAIASRTAAISAYFEDTMIEFFTPGDVEDLARCMLMLYRNRNRLAELAQNIEKFNQRYNWKAQSAGYVALVERLTTQ
jgi:glycosyltransferase involved in cell wall biosynthesis